MFSLTERTSPQRQTLGSINDYTIMFSLFSYDLDSYLMFLTKRTIFLILQKENSTNCTEADLGILEHPHTLVQDQLTLPPPWHGTSTHCPTLPPEPAPPPQPRNLIPDFHEWSPTQFHPWPNPPPQSLPNNPRAQSTYRWALPPS